MDEFMDIDVRVLFQGILKRAWIIIVCTILAAAVALMYTMNFVTPTYKASASMYINNNSHKGTTSDKVSSGDLAVALQLSVTYVNIIQSDAVLDKVVETTGFELTSNQIKSMMSAEVVGETEMFRISIVGPNAQMAADIVNAIADIAPDEISRIIEGSSAKVIDYAKVPNSQYGPNYTTNTVIGGFIGAVLSVAVIVITTLADTCIHTEADLTRIYQAPVLGAIPDFVASAKYSEKYGGYGGYGGYGEYKERRKA